MTLNIIGFRSLIYLPEALDSFQNNIYTNMGKWELFNFASKLINLKDEDIRKGFLRESAYDKVLDIGFYEAVSPDISWCSVAKRQRCLWIQGVRTEKRGGVASGYGEHLEGTERGRRGQIWRCSRNTMKYPG